MMNVLWLVGMLFAGQSGQSVPAANANYTPLVLGAHGAVGGGTVGSGQLAQPFKLPPIPDSINDPPTIAEILRTLPAARRSVPNVYEVSREINQFNCEKLVDKTDSARAFPLVGQAKFRHLHWRCTLCCTETIKIAYPFPIAFTTKHTDVIYVDKDHLIPCATEQRGLSSEAKCPCDAKPEQRVVTCWDERVQICPDVVHSRTPLSVLKGSVYLFDGKSNQTMAANGILLIEACDRSGSKLAQWHFDPVSLEKLKRTDLIGVGYTLCLPLDQRCLTEKDIRLTLTYRANDGKSCCDEPTRVTLRGDAQGVVQAVHAQPASFTLPRSAKASKQMTFTEIVTLAKRGVSDDIIIRQMELTESVYELTTEQILSLHEHGVSDSLIRLMQERRPVSNPNAVSQ